MRILFLSLWFPYPPDNGSKIRAYHLLRALRRSHQVTLVAFRPTDDSTNGQFLAHELDVSNVYPVPDDPFRYVNIPQALKFASPIPVVYWSSRLMRQTVAKVTNSGRWDAIVAMQSPMARYALQLPSVARILDVDTSLSYQRYEQFIGQAQPLARLRTWLSWQKVRRYETRLLRQFHACTVVSPVELDYVAAMVNPSNGRVQVVPNGVDCQQDFPGPGQPTPKALVYNGALTYSANYDAMHYFLSEIYPLIQRQLPDVSLTITGSTLGVNLAGLRLDESVRLSGYVDDIRPLVASAWACVVPIRQGGGTRLKILEAMALGTPVVTTSKGAEGLDVTDGVHVLQADDPAEFADRTLCLLRDQALRQRLAINARRLVEGHYSWTQIGQRFVNLIDDLASKSSLGGISS